MPRLTVALAAAALSAVVLVAGASGAVAAPDVADAATALRSGAAVYSDPAAENALTPAQVADLNARAAAIDVPVFVAVLPESAAGGGSVDETLIQLQSEVGLGGVYAIVLGSQFRAGATVNNALAADLATQALRESRNDGVAAVLAQFITLVGDQSGAPGSSSSTGSGGGAGLVVLLLIVVAGAVVVVVVVRRSRRRQAVQLASVRAAVDSDITEYGERLASRDIDDPDMDDAARADMQRALDGYDRAKAAVAHMRTPNDAQAVTTALEDGRYALSCVDARLARQPLPERRPPCFIDPRHGPSVGDVVWAPPGLGARDVPMCAACRTTVEAGGQPVGLEVQTANGQRPYYQAGPEFGAYAQGYYSPFAGVMTAVVMGTMLSSMWHVPMMTAGGLDQAGLGGGGGDGSGWGGFGGGGGFGDGGGGFGDGGFGGGDF